MTDTELMDWLCAHPVISRWDGIGDEEVTLTSFSSIGRGADFRRALVALIADDAASRHGIPTAGDRALAST